MGEVFLGREAMGDGLPRHELRRWYRPLFRGVYMAKRATPSLADRTLGAWLTSDRAGVIAGVAASALHGAAWVDDTVRSRSWWVIGGVSRGVGAGWARW